MSENIFDKLYDENNNDNVTLYNEHGEPVEFEQIAIIPIEDNVYFILRPVTKIEGVGEDEGLVFVVEKNDDGSELMSLITDADIIDAVFDIYDSLVEEAERNGK